MIEFTLKAGASYDAPWIVVKVNFLDEAIKILEDSDFPRVQELVKGHAKRFQGADITYPAPAPAKPAEAASGPQGLQHQQPSPGPDNPMPEGQKYTPMGEQKLPDSITPKCPTCGQVAPHKEGVSAKGTPYNGYYCQNKDCKDNWKEVKA